MAPARALLAAALVVLAASSVAHAQSNKCCHSFQGTPYADCKCLNDDKELLTETVETGQYVNYHWRLTNVRSTGWQGPNPAGLCKTAAARLLGADWRTLPAYCSAPAV